MSRKTIRAYFALGLLLLAIVATAGESIKVDGVAVSGNTAGVSIADIRDAIKAFGNVAHSKPESLVVRDKDHMRGYSSSRDVGWFTVVRTIAVEADGSQHPGPWNVSGAWLPGDTRALRLIKDAPEVYVFPVVAPLDPHRDSEQMRLLDKAARDALVNILGDDGVWMRGLNSLMYPPVKGQTVGLVFFDGSHELVLFYQVYGRWIGTFDGEHLSGDFDTGKDGEFEAWEHKYAQSELDYRAKVTP